MTAASCYLCWVISGGLRIIQVTSTAAHSDSNAYSGMNMLLIMCLWHGVGRHSVRSFMCVAVILTGLHCAKLPVFGPSQYDL